MKEAFAERPLQPGRVSVIIRVYNRTEYIAEAIESVLAQTYKNYEILVVDNGSTVGIRSVIQPYRDRIRYLYKERGTVGSAANFGIISASDEFVAFLDDDDLWHPQMLEKVMDAFNKDTQTDAVFTSSKLFYGQNTRDLHPSYAEPYFGAAHAGQDLLGLLCEGNFIALCATVLRRSAVEELEGFDPTLEIAEDWDLWLRMLSAEKKFRSINIPLCFHRRHHRNITGDPMRIHQQDAIVLKKLLTYVGPHYKPRVRRSLAKRKRALGGILIRDGRVWEGARAFVESITCHHTDPATVTQGILALLVSLLKRVALSSETSDTMDQLRRKENKTILFISDSSGLGGAEFYLETLIHHLSDKKYLPIIVWPPSPAMQTLRKKMEDSGVAVLTWDFKGAFSSLITLWRLHRRYPIDLIHFSLHYPGSCKYFLLWQALLERPFMITEHADYLIQPSKYRRIIEEMLIKRLAYPRAKSVIFVSEDLKSKLLSRYGVKDTPRYRVIRNGIAPDRFPVLSSHEKSCLRAKLGISPDTTVITTVARLSPEKGYPVLLECIKDLVPLYKDKKVAYLWVGTGPLEKSLQDRILQFDLGDSIILTGHRNDVPALLSASDIFVLPSLNEGLNFSILEAMVACLPVVATRVGGNPEIVLEGETGFLVPPHNAQALGCTLGVLIDDSSLRISMGTSGRKRALEHFNEDRMINETFKIYEPCLEP